MGCHMRSDCKRLALDHGKDDRRLGLHRLAIEPAEFLVVQVIGGGDQEIEPRARVVRRHDHMAAGRQHLGDLAGQLAGSDDGDVHAAHAAIGGRGIGVLFESLALDVDVGGQLVTQIGQLARAGNALGRDQELDELGAIRQTRRELALDLHPGAGAIAQVQQSTHVTLIIVDGERLADAEELYLTVADVDQLQRRMGDQLVIRIFPGFFLTHRPGPPPNRSPRSACRGDPLAPNVSRRAGGGWRPPCDSASAHPS